MMIFVEGRQAFIKSGSSFEYVSENRLFSGSDGYTLSITFPLEGCLPNLDIFGNINRADVAAGKMIFDCVIHAGDFVRTGCLTVVDISQSEVKAQFLDGRSEANFDKTFDDIYINELDLGSPAENDLSPALVSAQKASSVSSGTVAVALPWVNNSSGNIQNCMVRSDDGSLSWHEDTEGLSWMPFLSHIVRKVCEAVGYSVDLSAWESRPEYRYILLCNTLPYVWDMPQYAAALPHWTVDEFFSKLELFLNGEFTVDHREKSVSFAFSRDVLLSSPAVSLDNVVDEFSQEVTVRNPENDYSESRNQVYKSGDGSMWKFWSCRWFVRSFKDVVRYDTLSELLSKNKALATWNGSNQRASNRNKMLYAADCDLHFVVRAVARRKVGENPLSGIYTYKCVLQPLNMFGGRILDESDDADEDEIEVVPVVIDFTDDSFGKMPFLSFSSMSDDGGTSYSDIPTSDDFQQTRTVQMLDNGEKEKPDEFFGQLYVGWYDGSGYDGIKSPHPLVENIWVSDNWENIHTADFSFRLDGDYPRERKRVFDIDQSRKYTFKFLADSLPDVRAVFIIRGKRYVCKQLTATFTESGMSQLIKGVFFPIRD